MIVLIDVPCLDNTVASLGVSDEFTLQIGH